LKDMSLFGQLNQNCPSISEFVNASDTAKYKASHPYVGRTRFETGFFQWVGWMSDVSDLGSRGSCSRF
jgi:hypothetical protein